VYPQSAWRIEFSQHTCKNSAARSAPTDDDSGNPAPGGNGAVRDRNSKHAAGREIQRPLCRETFPRCPQIRNSFVAPWAASPPV
jgi:hypothetical protein